MANKNIDGDVNVQFTEASSRQSLETGESVKTLFGKLRKWLSDLKPVAFSGSYNDLSDKPTIDNTLVYIQCTTANYNTAKSLLQAGKAVITTYNNHTFPVSLYNNEIIGIALHIASKNYGTYMQIAQLAWSSSYCDIYYRNIRPADY